MLTICSAGWPPISHTLLENSISDPIQNLLMGSISVHKPGSTGVRTPENLQDVVSFIDAMLPGVEETNNDDDVQAANHRMRVKFLESNPEIASNLGRDLLPLLLRVFFKCRAFAKKFKISSHPHERCA